MEETNFTGRAMCGAQHTPQLSCWAAQSRPRCSLQVKYMQMPFRSQIHGPSGIWHCQEPHVIRLQFGTVALLQRPATFCFTSSQKSGSLLCAWHVQRAPFMQSPHTLFLLGTCKRYNMCNHQTLCWCLAGAKGTLCALTRHFVSAWQMLVLGRCKGDTLCMHETLCWWWADVTGTVPALTGRCARPDGLHAMCH